MSTFDIGRYHELLANSKTFFGADTQTCEILVQRYRSRRQGVLTLLNRISQELDVAVVDLAGALCRTERCATKLNGVILYRDDGHLSVDGSRELGRQVDLAGKLLAAAR